MKAKKVYERLKAETLAGTFPCLDKYGIPVVRNHEGQHDPFAVFSKDKKSWSGIFRVDSDPVIQRVLDENPEYHTYIGDHDWASIQRAHDRLAEGVWDGEEFLRKVRTILGVEDA